MIVVSYSYLSCAILHYPGTCLGSRTWPPLHLDAVVAMRSESRTGPRAMAAVIFSFCFFEMLVFVLRAADRHTLAAQRSAGKHPHAHAGVCTDGSGKGIRYEIWVFTTPEQSCLICPANTAGGNGRHDCSGVGFYAYFLILLYILY